MLALTQRLPKTPGEQKDCWLPSHVCAVPLANYSWDSLLQAAYITMMRVFRKHYLAGTGELLVPTL